MGTVEIEPVAGGPGPWQRASTLPGGGDRQSAAGPEGRHRAEGRGGLELGRDLRSVGHHSREPEGATASCPAPGPVRGRDLLEQAVTQDDT